MTIYHKPTRVRLTWPLGNKTVYRVRRDNGPTMMLQRREGNEDVIDVEIYVVDGTWYHAGWPVDVEVLR